jgi:hypothetical protein
MSRELHYNCAYRECTKQSLRQGLSASAEDSPALTQRSAEINFCGYLSRKQS